MGLLDFIFGSKKDRPAQGAKPKLQQNKGRNISFLDDLDFIEITSINFIGQFAKSASGEWIICWSDSDEQRHRGGAREQGRGRYVLCNSLQDKVVLQGKLQRPNAGSVANNGRFSIEDWHFGNGLSSTLYIFNSDGQQLIKRKFGANIYNSAISPTGNYAVCQTCSSPKSKDDNCLTAFDVESCTELFSVQPSTAWANSYQFVDEPLSFAVVIDKIGVFRYDGQGRFVDTQKYGAARLACDRYEVVLMAAEDVLKVPDSDGASARGVLEAVRRARALGADKDRGWNAVAFKIEGLAHEVLNDSASALAAFDQALAINPKIGLKRRADSLRKKSR